MFSTFDCAVKGYRQKEDMWNGIISGFLTGGCLAARSEFPSTVSCFPSSFGPPTQALPQGQLLLSQSLTLLHEQVGPGVLSRLPSHAASCSVFSRVSVCSCQGYSTRVLVHNYHQVSKSTSLARSSSLSPFLLSSHFLMRTHSSALQTHARILIRRQC